MVDQFFFGLGLALLLRCDLLIRGTVFILRYRMALEAVIGAGQLPGGRLIDCAGSRGEQKGSDANRGSDQGYTSARAQVRLLERAVGTNPFDGALLGAADGAHWGKYSSEPGSRSSLFIR